jgi:hypothetical protein
MANPQTALIDQSIDVGVSVNMDADPLGKLCHEAHKDDYSKTRGCSGCVKFFAWKMGVFLPSICDTADGRANALVDYMNSNWTKVNKEQALFYAKAGKLVVGGKKESGPGHVVVILPAMAQPKNRYGKGQLSLVCCSMTIPGAGYAGAIIDANATVWDAWGNENGVEYWLAPGGASACAGKPLMK